MLSMESIKKTLKQLYYQYDDIKIGIAGSYANNTETEDSDLDIVIDGDSRRLDIMEQVKRLFNVQVDVLWVDLMKQEDEELDAFAREHNLPINKYSVYKTVMHEVIWI
ncbi:MAG: nucleotidyltransferase domain-containing protein [Lachnospiraceae bacterium]|nr:nucleotidyltransferase domain-containing protein [Lachnospiraceae bacterium]